MTQAQTAPRESVETGFKRFILKETSAFAHEPNADLYRVNLLGQMLDRYDELRDAGLGDIAASARVRREFHDIADRMREMGFEQLTAEDDFSASMWPQLTEDGAAQYIRERDAYLHKQSLGIAMCASCVFPLMVGAAIGASATTWQAEEAYSLLGLVGMFAMIAVGVYSIVLAKKPEKEKDVKRGRFSLGNRLRRKLNELREGVEEKARRRKGKGIAMLVGCVAPIFVGAALDSITGLWASPFAMLGVGGMFVMIGAGVYELVMADGEKKTMKRLLDKRE